MILLAKLILVPCIIALVTMAGRLWGPQVSGLLAGLPVIAGPILVFLALDHGSEFAATSAHGLLLGVISLGLFCYTYAHVCRRNSVSVSLAASVLTFFVATFVLDAADLSGLSGLVAVVAVLIGYVLTFPSPRTPPVDLPISIKEISARMATAALVVLLITSGGSLFGPRLSGLLAPFPVAGTVLAAFTHYGYGPESTIRLLRGFLRGLFGMAAFAFVMTSLLSSVTLAYATTLAVVSALCVGLIASLLFSSGNSLFRA